MVDFNAGYASGVSASAAGDSSAGQRVDIAFELTSKGLAFWPDLVAATVGYVAMLRDRGFPRHRADELERLADLAWDYSEPGRADDVATGLASTLQEVGWDDSSEDQQRVLALFRRRGAGAGLPAGAAISAADDLLANGLTLANLCLTVTAREFLRDDSYWPQLASRERWYGTRYAEYAFDGSSIAQLAALKAPPRGGVSLPRPNPWRSGVVRLVRVGTSHHCRSGRGSTFAAGPVAPRPNPLRRGRTLRTAAPPRLNLLRQPVPRNIRVLAAASPRLVPQVPPARLTPPLSAAEPAAAARAASCRRSHGADAVAGRRKRLERTVRGR